MKHLNEIELVMALDGEMEPDELQQAVEHLAECDECREQWEKLQGLSARVAEYHNALYAHPVAQEQRLSDKDGARFVVAARNLAFRVPSWGLAAAAVVLLVVGM